MRKVRSLLSAKGPKWLQFVLLAMLYFLYLATRIRSTGAAAEALVNAHRIVALEGALGILVERDIQGWTLDSRLWGTVANLLYIVPHFPMMLGLLWWTYRRRPDSYVLVRNIFFASSLVGFLVFVVFPVAPPLAVAELGVVDTLVLYGPVGYHMGAENLRNAVAAVPSLHIVYALIASAGFVKMAGSWVWRLLAAQYVPLAAFATVATGNHFVLDAVAAIPALALGALVAWWVGEGPHRPGDGQK